MVTVNVRVVSVNDVTTSTGETVTVYLGVVQDPTQTMISGSINADITGQADQITFYKTNVGKVLQLPIDITTVKVV